jgi:hypothetical protein
MAILTPAGRKMMNSSFTLSVSHREKENTVTSAIKKAVDVRAGDLEYNTASETVYTAADPTQSDSRQIIWTPDMLVSGIAVDGGNIHCVMISLRSQSEEWFVHYKATGCSRCDFRGPLRQSLQT